MSSLRLQFAHLTSSSQRSPGLRRLDGTAMACFPAMYWPGQGRLGALQVGQGALGHDLAAVLAGPGADVDQVVGGADGGLVVLDHDQGVAEVAQPDQGLDQPVVVALVQPDGGLVEHVQHPGQAGADLGGQPIRHHQPARVADARSMPR